jgi:hypothetical protein
MSRISTWGPAIPLYVRDTGVFAPGTSIPGLYSNIVLSAGRGKRALTRLASAGVMLFSAAFCAPPEWPAMPSRSSLLACKQIVGWLVARLL